MEEDTSGSERSYVQRSGNLDRQVVCKYFLLNKCSRGTKCRYLHEEDPEKTPVCYFYLEGRCLKANCKFKHSVTRKECVFYNAGFCQYGKWCRFVHKKRKLCWKIDCSCKYHHIDQDFMDYYLEEAYALTVSPVNAAYLFILCWNCGEFGHIKSKCPLMICLLYTSDAADE